MIAQYRILSPAGEQREDGGADVDVADGALVLAPSAGGVLRVPFGQIASVTEPKPFTVRVTLADGNVIDLSRLGVMRTQLLAELRDGRGDGAAAATAAVGDAAVFSGFSGDEQAEIRVYDGCLLVIGAAGSERISFSFVGTVQAADYAVRVEVAGRDPVTLRRLGRRTGELVSLLNDRLREARGRTATFLGSLLPGLRPMALRDAAGLLRDGVAVPASALDSIHPELARTLVRVAALPARRGAIADLARRAELAIGFKQLVSIRQDAAGVTSWRDHAATPHIGGHESPGGAFRPGLMGMMAAGVMESGPPMGPGVLGGGYGTSPFGAFEGYGGYGDYWAFRALGAGMNSGSDRPMAARPDVTRGRLTPATEDLSALTVTGEDATVLAFVLASNAGRVAYEVLNQQTPATFVYRVDGPGGLAAINRALDDAGFQAAAVHAEGLTAPARPAVGPATGAQVLAAALTGRATHDAQWSARITELLEPR